MANSKCPEGDIELVTAGNEAGDGVIERDSIGKGAWGPMNNGHKVGKRGRRNRRGGHRDDED